ncbi:alcohol dehydrogenase catalytic domain-containing protein [Streptomyces sp. NPDC001507]|uniref:alcohol dehydrogenase catalytic domain-containing protein n=1 Tax=Streptomyces sp. NPDC001507 TaxID=3364579 RepID=UPI0036C09C6A
MTCVLPATSRAAALTAPGRPLELLDVEIPTVIERDALLVRMTSATLCGTDVHVADGAADDVRDALPLILGREMVGRIVAFGDGPRTDSLGRPLTEGTASCGPTACAVAAGPVSSTANPVCAITGAGT